MLELLDTINKKYSCIKLLNIFTDGPTSQFKQRLLFSNLHGWENEFISKLFGISLLPLMGKEQSMELVAPENARFGEMSTPHQLPQMMQ